MILFSFYSYFYDEQLANGSAKVARCATPGSSGAVQQKHVPVIITLDTAGHIVIDGKPLSLTDAKEVLVTKQEANPAVAVVLQADAHSAHGQVVAIMDLVRSAGIKKFSIGATNK